MNTDEHRCEQGIDRLTEQTIACAFKVSNALGAGFLEKVYENALCHEISKSGLSRRQQAPIGVEYDGVQVGDYFADIIVEDCVVLEIKAGKGISEHHQAQLLNYLRATGIHVGLILNFGTPKLGIKRMILG